MKKRTVLLAGASGLVGGHMLRGLLADPDIATVHCLVRRPLGVIHPKLEAHVVDFQALPATPHADELYLALGTTIKLAGSQAAFRAIDYDANLAVARAALNSGVHKAGLVSAMGADSGSSIFYNRVKGELEDKLTQMPFEGLVIARPSLLLGDRAALGQPRRPGEQLGETLGKMLGFLIPRNYRPIKADSVASALLRAVPGAIGTHVLLSGELR